VAGSHENRGPEVLTSEAVLAFRQKIYRHFHDHGRMFPWRATHDPYHILVSEVMLQQTPVDRVVAKYEEFIATFPDWDALARAPLAGILEVWLGLGYNRRALALQGIARRLVEEFEGRLPASVEALRSLPGIGAVTAAAIAAFAFDQPSIFIETNIRRVFIHCFFSGRDKVSDRDIAPLLERTMDTAGPRTWYYALMDYGAMLKGQYGNPNRRSAHYRRQAPFADSDRQIRGLILKVLLGRAEMSVGELVKAVAMDRERVERNLSQLGKEGFVVRQGARVRISSGPNEVQGEADASNCLRGEAEPRRTQRTQRESPP
jgi:A/G-specific adenine glycosylase